MVKGDVKLFHEVKPDVILADCPGFKILNNGDILRCCVNHGPEYNDSNNNMEEYRQMFGFNKETHEFDKWLGDGTVPKSTRFHKQKKSHTYCMGCGKTIKAYKSGFQHVRSNHCNRRISKKCIQINVLVFIFYFIYILYLFYYYFIIILLFIYVI